MAVAPLEPVHLVEDGDSGDRFLLYTTEKGVQVELRYAGDTLWLSQAQMADLFGVERSVVTKHLSNVYQDGELNQSATSAKIAQVRKEGGREVTRHLEHYNLDAVISVGYRVSSSQGTQFRRWATEKLVQFATKGFVVDAQRLKRPDSYDRVRELREIIRDIRSDEANVYRELRRICSLCSDYDPNSQSAQDFYRRMQAVIMYGVTSETPSETIISRANADHPNMGLRSWAKDEVKKADVTVAKNYLTEREVTELNRLTSILLDVFEDQLDIGRITKMVQLENTLNKQLVNLGRAILAGGGRVKRTAADAHASEQYVEFDKRRKAIRHAEADRVLAELKTAEKALPRGKGKPA